MINLNQLKAIVFDADNTLYSTRKIAKDADMAAMAALSPAVKEDPEKLYQEFIEIVKTVKNSLDPKIRHRKYSYGMLCAKYGQDLIEKMYSAFEETVLDKLEKIPEAEALLERLKNKECYVVTEDNSDMANKKLTKLGLISRFKSVITSDSAGSMKPSKNYFTELLSKFKPEEILVIGDNYEKDLELPEELGMQIFLVDEPSKIRTLL